MGFALNFQHQNNKTKIIFQLKFREWTNKSVNEKIGRLNEDGLTDKNENDYLTAKFLLQFMFTILILMPANSLWLDFEPMWNDQRYTKEDCRDFAKW